MNNIYLKSLAKILLISVFSLVSGLSFAKSEKGESGKSEKETESQAEPAPHRIFRLLATHGTSHLSAPQLIRLGVIQDEFVIGVGAGLFFESGLGFDLDFLLSENTRKDKSDYAATYNSNATTRFRHDRLSLGLNWRFRAAKHLYLFPEGGLSYNMITVDLREMSYHEEQSTNAVGWHVGAGANIPIKRVFFDFRMRYGYVDLKMDKLGVDSRVYISTFLFGFGFTL